LYKALLAQNTFTRWVKDLNQEGELMIQQGILPFKLERTEELITPRSGGWPADRPGGGHGRPSDGRRAFRSGWSSSAGGKPSFISSNPRAIVTM